MAEEDEIEIVGGKFTTRVDAPPSNLSTEPIEEQAHEMTESFHESHVEHVERAPPRIDIPATHMRAREPSRWQRIRDFAAAPAQKYINREKAYRSEYEKARTRLLPEVAEEKARRDLHKRYFKEPSKSLNWARLTQPSPAMFHGGRRGGRRGQRVQRLAKADRRLLQQMRGMRRPERRGFGAAPERRPMVEPQRRQMFEPSRSPLEGLVQPRQSSADFGGFRNPLGETKRRKK